VLLILSEHSVRSEWVKKEAETAFEKERKTHKLVLFPIQIDDAVKKTRVAWAADLRRMRNIGDMQRWKEHDAYVEAFDKLLHWLESDAVAQAARPPRRGRRARP
jgi:hypothetical protein